MSDYVKQHSVRLQIDPTHAEMFRHIEAAVEAKLNTFETPIRFAVTEASGGRWTCELGTHTGSPSHNSLFSFNPREYEDTSSFNVVMLVPTGIGAVVGGHAGDATPAATLLSSVCDTLITHPNVLNASDIIQIPSNALYVEGSTITQLMMGTIGLRRVRNNRLLVLVQVHEDKMFTDAAINSVNAARASYGLHANIAEIDPRFRMISHYTPGGSAAGRIEGIEYIYDILDGQTGEFDAIAITSVIELPWELHKNYYRLVDDVVNPWGGVEAMLTHTITMRYGLPAAHAPMLESKAVAEADFGVVDPRMAAEVISLAFFQCVLRGLQASPAIMETNTGGGNELRTENIGCLVIPDGCIGLPTLAALRNGVPVVAVSGNTNLMKNNLDSLPWKPGRFFRVNNYLEAAGVVASLRAGVAPSTLLRPLALAPTKRLDNLVLEESLPVPISQIQESSQRYDQ